MEGFRRASPFGPILAPQEGPVEHGTCSTNHGTHLEGLLSQKKWYLGVQQCSLMEGFRRASSFGPVLAPQEGPVEHGTCITIHGTH